MNEEEAYVKREITELTVGELIRFLDGRPTYSPYNGKLKVLESLKKRLDLFLGENDHPMKSGVIQIGGSNTGAIAQGDHAEAAVCPGPNGEEGALGTELIYPGHTVRLRSGGPLMTVLEVTEAGVRCAWFLGKDNREGLFPAVALTKESPAWRSPAGKQ